MFHFVSVSQVLAFSDHVSYTYLLSRYTQTFLLSQTLNFAVKIGNLGKVHSTAFHYAYMKTIDSRPAVMASTFVLATLLKTIMVVLLAG